MRTHVSPLLSAVASVIGVIVFLVSLLLEHPYYRWMIVGIVTMIVVMKMVF